jgi:hypothetical protein
MNAILVSIVSCATPPNIVWALRWLQAALWVAMIVLLFGGCSHYAEYMKAIPQGKSACIDLNLTTPWGTETGHVYVSDIASGTVTCDGKSMTVSSGQGVVVTPLPQPAPTGSIIITPSGGKTP